MKKILILSIVLLLSVVTTAVAGGQKEKIEKEGVLGLINWDAPKTALERLTGDEYILPEGWDKTTEGVEKIFYFNSGAMRHDPATAKNIEVFENLTGIKVDYAEVGSDILFQKTINVFVSRDGSVHGMSLTDGPNELKEVIGAGWAEPMPFWTPEVRKAYPAGLVSAMTGADGKVYATVDTMRSYLLFYRPSWLKAADIEKVPTTWQEVREAAKKAGDWARKNLGPDYYGIVFPAKAYNLLHMIQAGVYSQGGRIIQADGIPVYNTEEGKKSWDYWVNLVKDGIAPEAVLGWTWNDYQEVFARGKSAFMLGFTTYVNRSADQELSPALHKDVFGNPDKGAKGLGDWAVVAPPKWNANMPDDYRAAFIDFDAFVVNKFADEKHKAAALLFAEFRMSKQAMANELIIEGNESFYPGAYEDPDVASKILYPEPRAQSARTTVMEAFPPGTVRAMDILIEYFARAVTGELSSQEALNKAQEEIDMIFK
ncbi:MAG: hypothetical protein DRP87_06565 [Spirochaetes bacterium]|nr:MAG: hypothetical protein DRP87_06565 [Spirochaetota bacterium]